MSKDPNTIKTSEHEINEITIESPKTTEPTDISQILADSHDNILPFHKVIVVFLALASSLFLSFIDQSGLTISLPFIAKELNAQETISWAGTSSLIGQTTFMILFGRFSDIFSRKYVIILSILILALADLSCGFATKSYQFYIFRSFAGIGNGGIMSLSMMITSDIISLEQRGVYQGIMGSFVGLGNIAGPFLSSGFININLENLKCWRYFYYLIAPLLIIDAVLLWVFVPFTHHKQDFTKQLKQIDSWGFLSSSVSIIFFLIPISGGGSTFNWSSPLVISFFIISFISLIVFIIIELNFAKLPMIPIYLFHTKPSLTFLFSHNFFFGISYFGMLYYIPYYLQLIRGYSSIDSSKFLLCLTIPTMISSFIGGYEVSRSKRYWYVIWTGYILWTIGICLLSLWNEHSSIVPIIASLIISGFGVGCIFQPTLIALQAHSFRKDRAVVITIRNMLRGLGGCVGLSVSSTILSNFYIKKLNSSEGFKLFTKSEILNLEREIYTKFSLDLYTSKQIEFLKRIYMESLKNVFYLWIACIIYCLFTNATVRDHGLESIDGEKKSDEETSSNQEKA
ncbi:putative transporter [Wickerhamomyces ciferrii]|uniref:Transporter n=1 Tax=Wickerhamomyces ciferrii (strain ATCC 14091 / BCRC 22168 / CBS 111 / JCM 3599 / NBRC 0793 / NRRL Y-1031 F-60-10) TaxID=1206466 RepID=K0KTW4_WICCF|nr:putative transporter [Wickerhamomyces ciferrii]CCH45462.1 putative transporter [Wickerhamomyces ciferrii]